MKQEIARSHASHSRKEWLLGTVSALAMGVTALSPAWARIAPETQADPVAGGAVSGYTVLLANPGNSAAALSALIADNLGGIIGFGSSAITTANSFTASAGGNDVTNTISGTMLPLPNVSLLDVPGPDGVAALNNSTNASVVATAMIATSNLVQQLSTNVSAATLAGNSMTANVTLNQSTTTVQGQVPINYVADTQSYIGASSSASLAGSNEAIASVLATTAQFNSASGEAAGSDATVIGSGINQMIITANGKTPVLNGSPGVTGNSLTAGFAGNAATTNLTIAAGGAPTFFGTTALTNIQQNSGDTGVATDPAALVSNSSIAFGPLFFIGDGGGEVDYTLRGALAVTGNIITASATGNQAAGTTLSGPTGNILTLAGGIGLQGSGEAPYASNIFTGASPATLVFGDAIINNWQNNSVAPLDSMVLDSAVGVLVPAVAGGSITLSNNTVTAQTVGNEAYNALLAPGLGSPATGSPLYGVLAVNSLQSNQSSPLTATTNDGGVVLLIGAADTATLVANANAITATATGNSVINTINLNASSLPSYSGYAATTYGERNPTDSYSTRADVMVNSLQANDVSSPVMAVNIENGVGFEAISGGGVDGSAVSVTNNVIAALATGNAATNSLTLNAASVMASAAILGAQSSYGAVTATLTEPVTMLAIGEEDPTNTTLVLRDNLQRAIATGNSANSTLSVTGSSISIANSGGPASAFSYVPGLAFPIGSVISDQAQITAGFVAHNDQATTAPVSATVTFGMPSMPIMVSTDGLTSSTADNSANAVVAAGRGNQGITQLTLSPSSSLGVYVGGNEEEGLIYSPVAVVANVQTLGDATSVLASIVPGGDKSKPGEAAPLPPIYIAVSDGGLTGTTVTLAANQIAALAQGNNATNGLTLVSTGAVAEPVGIQLGLLAPPLSTGDTPSTVLTADAAFVVHNVQYAGTGPVTATQDTTGVQAAISGDIVGSTVTVGGSSVLLGNTIASTATANLASNSLTLGAANLSASGGLLNFQVSNGAASATMGEAGTLPFPATSTIVLAYTTNTDNGVFSGSSQTNEGSTQQYTGWLVSTDPNSTLDGFVQGTGANSANYYDHVVNYVFTQAVPVQLNTQASFTNTVPGSAGVLGSPGLVVALDGNVTNSVVGITQNTVNATSTANAANNTVAVTSAMSSSTLSFEPAGPPGGGNFTRFGAFVNPVDGASVMADAALLNNQTLGDAGSSKAVANGSFWIGNMTEAPVYTNVTLSISDNTQQANALGNSATNILTLSPGITPDTAVPVSASILSEQTVSSSVEVPVSAKSNMMIGAPMALVGSTLIMSGNTNTASAIANDVANTLTVNGTTSLPGNEKGQINLARTTLTTPSVGAAGDYTVVNSQVVSAGSVQSTAATAMINNDLYLDPADSSDTSVSVDSNTLVAQALGNRASSILTITAAGSSGATGAVANGQINMATIGAAATLDLTFAVGQAAGTQVGSSSSNTTYSVTNNTTQALATGNQASNALNASPTAYGSAAGTKPGGTVSAAGNATTAATFAVLNSQFNSGPVTAAVIGASPTLLTGVTNGGGGYIMALNTSGTGNVINVSGNTVTSQAIGNRADNAITLAALNTGTASTAITSVQQNTGAISASISNVQVGAGLSAGSVGRVANNVMAANAFGNIVTNSIITH